MAIERTCNVENSLQRTSDKKEIKIVDFILSLLH